MSGQHTGKPRLTAEQCAVTRELLGASLSAEEIAAILAEPKAPDELFAGALTWLLLELSEHPGRLANSSAQEAVAYAALADEQRVAGMAEAVLPAVLSHLGGSALRSELTEFLDVVELTPQSIADAVAHGLKASSQLRLNIAGFLAARACRRASHHVDDEITRAAVAGCEDLLLANGSSPTVLATVDLVNCARRLGCAASARTLETLLDRPWVEFALMGVFEGRPEVLSRKVVEKALARQAPEFDLWLLRNPALTAWDRWTLYTRYAEDFAPVAEGMARWPDMVQLVLGTGSPDAVLTIAQHIGHTLAEVREELAEAAVELLRSRRGVRDCAVAAAIYRALGEEAGMRIAAIDAKSHGVAVARALDLRHRTLLDFLLDSPASDLRHAVGARVYQVLKAETSPAGVEAAAHVAVRLGEDAVDKVRWVGARISDVLRERSDPWGRSSGAASSTVRAGLPARWSRQRARPRR